MSKDYNELMKEWYDKHENFDEFIAYYELDEDKILEHFKDILYNGFRRPGSWEGSAISSMFNIDDFFKDFKNVK